MTDIVQSVGAACAALMAEDVPARIGVAVSGGSDSLALMLILQDWAAARGIPLFSVTVDHGLRAEAAQEAARVAAIAAERGIPHQVLRWEGWDGQGNLQDQARRARYALIAQWARGHDIAHVALGHTADDQAETILMRLARGAGVDGLSAIPRQRLVEGVVFMRPLLDQPRADLRAWLDAQGQPWIDDPSNDDRRFDRIKAREALEILAPMGLTRDGLVQVAHNMAEARKALNWFTFLSARDFCVIEAGDVLIDRSAFRALPDEIQRRLLAHCLRWISGAEYPPRRRPLQQMMAAACAGTGMTLHGVQLLGGGPTIRLTREAGAVAETRCKPGELWDGRWRMIGPADGQDLHVAALGEAGLAQCPNWREAGLTHATMLACPAVWHGETVIAAPLARMGRGWRQVLARDEDDFFAALMSR